MNANTNPDRQALLGMTADTLGKDLLSALVQEVKLLPDVWPKLSQHKQDDVIERLRKRVETNVKMAVHLIASQGRSTITGELESITVKDQIKAVFTVGKNDAGRHDLIDAQGKACLLVVADIDANTGGMDAVKGERDQREMDLNAGDETFARDEQGDVVDAEFKALPAPTPDHNGDAATDPIYKKAVLLVVRERRISAEWLAEHLGVELERAEALVSRMQTDGVVSSPDAAGARVVFWAEEDLPEDFVEGAEQ